MGTYPVKTMTRMSAKHDDLDLVATESMVWVARLRAWMACWLLPHIDFEDEIGSDTIITPPLKATHFEKHE